MGASAIEATWSRQRYVKGATQSGSRPRVMYLLLQAAGRSPSPRAHPLRVAEMNHRPGGRLFTCDCGV
eukprot:6574674-Prymnesium_polylepis.1